MARAHTVVATLLLGPCAHTGDPASDTDWWGAQHVSCPGWDSLRPGIAVQCTCPCHSDPTSPEAVARRATEELQLSDADGMELWRAARAGAPGHGVPQ